MLKHKWSDPNISADGMMGVMRWTSLLILAGFTNSLVSNAQEKSQTSKPSRQTSEKYDSKNGSEVLQNLRRKLAPLMRRLAEEHGYGLAEDEAVRHVPLPLPALRNESFQIMQPGISEAYLAQPVVSLPYHWKNDELIHWGMWPLDPENPGASVLTLIDFLLDIKSHRIEGRPHLLKQGITGDWVLRVGSSENLRLEQLNEILSEEAPIPVRLRFKNEKRSVYVASGRYKIVPLPGHPSEDKTQLIDRFRISDLIHVFKKEADLEGDLTDGGTGDFNEFLEILGRRIQIPLLNELTTEPTRDVSWKIYITNDSTPEDLLNSVTRQTGLTFEKTEREVRILAVEKI